MFILFPLQKDCVVECQYLRPNHTGPLSYGPTAEERGHYGTGTGLAVWATFTVETDKKKTDRKLHHSTQRKQG